MTSSSGPFSRLIQELDDMHSTLEALKEDSPEADTRLTQQLQSTISTLDQSRKQIRRIVKTLDIQVPGILNY